jgi:DNA polymerase-1
MEKEGIRLDTDFLSHYHTIWTMTLKDMKPPFMIAGENFNLASPKQLGDVLFDKLKIGGAKQRKQKTGQYATGRSLKLLS